MNKDQFKLQVYNNRYMRGVIVAICKIIIWTFIYTLIVSVGASVLASETAVTTVGNSYNLAPNATFGPGAIFCSLVILVVTVVYLWAVIAEVVRRIKQNKQLTEYENEYFDSGKTKE